MHYFELWLGEAEWKQAVRYKSDHECALQVHRNYAQRWAGRGRTSGGAGSGRGPMRQREGGKCLDGHLNGQPEDIGR